jgi:hypothetical protein
MADEGLLDLADVLKRLGEEFRDAAQVDEPTIQWYGAEVELETVVTRGGDGGVRFWVVTAEGSLSQQKTVRIRVNLAPFGHDALPAGK